MDLSQLDENEEDGESKDEKSANGKAPNQDDMEDDSPEARVRIFPCVYY